MNYTITKNNETIAQGELVQYTLRDSEMHLLIKDLAPITSLQRGKLYNITVTENENTITTQGLFLSMVYTRTTRESEIVVGDNSLFFAVAE